MNKDKTVFYDGIKRVVRKLIKTDGEEVNTLKFHEEEINNPHVPKILSTFYEDYKGKQRISYVEMDLVKNAKTFNAAIIDSTDEEIVKISESLQAALSSLNHWYNDLDNLENILVDDDGKIWFIDAMLMDGDLVPITAMVNIARGMKPEARQKIKSVTKNAKKPKFPLSKTWWANFNL